MEIFFQNIPKWDSQLPLKYCEFALPKFAATASLNFGKEKYFPHEKIVFAFSKIVWI